MGPRANEIHTEMRIDAAEAKDATKGAGDQETTIIAAQALSNEVGIECERVILEKKNQAKDSHAEEQEKDCKNRPTVNDAVDDTEGVNPPESHEDMDTSGFASSKRLLHTTDDKTTESHANGPPAMTTVTRRDNLKPRPNIPPDKKGGNKSSQTADHARPAGGPGDV
ncbi:hypothetical protein HPB51_000578 [Rhipicephalus microplus]|uniref:Uncharacterized protein n=1 Tax=Rhipicephalus microplus TaxID=6941 RepID=A0A9J6EQX2_RHIMP|nr:hypothetical protein HPB51_000578 [Rhipicephalus microplus]